VQLSAVDPRWRCDFVGHGVVREPRPASTATAAPPAASTAPATEDDGRCVAVTAATAAVALPGAGLVEWAFATFGPFVIPVAVFVAGVVGYFLLLLLGRVGLVGRP
jgi:hypothetical protein